MGNRRQIGAVGLEHDRVEPDGAYRLAHRFRRLEGDDAADPEHHRELAGEGARLLGVAGEAVDDPPLGRRVEPFAQCRDEVVVRVTCMKDQRQPALARVGELPREDSALDIPRAVVVVIIETGLADCDDSSAVLLEQGVEEGREIVWCGLRLVGVDADRRREIVGLSDLAGAAAIFDVTANRNDGLDTCLARPGKQRLTVFVEPTVLHVGVRVDHGEPLGPPVLSSPERPRDDRRLLVVALVLSILIHLITGGVFTFWGHRIAEVAARMLPHPKPTPEQLAATSDVITIEKRPVPREVHRQPATRPAHRSPQSVAQRPVERAIPVPTLAPIPTIAPTSAPTSAPTTVATAAPSAPPRRAKIHRGNPVHIAMSGAAAQHSNTHSQPQTERKAATGAFSPEQVAALNAQFSQTIQQAQQSLTDTPRQTKPPSTTKRYSLIMNGKPEDVLDAQGYCRPLQTQDLGPTTYVYYQCSIVYSDRYTENVSFPWPFRFPRGREPRPGDTFAKQGPPDGFSLPHPFALSRAVCSFYRKECDAVISSEQASGTANLYGAPP